MFAGTFFAARYFAPRYFPRPSGVVPPTPVPTTNHKGGATIYVIHENPDDLRKKRKLRREDEEILFL